MTQGLEGHAFVVRVLLEGDASIVRTTWEHARKQGIDPDIGGGGSFLPVTYVRQRVGWRPRESSWPPRQRAENLSDLPTRHPGGATAKPIPTGLYLGTIRAELAGFVFWSGLYREYKTNPDRPSVVAMRVWDHARRLKVFNDAWDHLLDDTSNEHRPTLWDGRLWLGRLLRRIHPDGKRRTSPTEPDEMFAERVAVPDNIDSSQAILRLWPEIELFVGPPVGSIEPPTDAKAGMKRPGRVVALPSPGREPDHMRAVATTLRKCRKAKQAALVELMIDRECVPVDEVARIVHGDDEADEKTIRANADRTNTSLEDLGSPFSFRLVSGRMFREKSPE